MSCTVEDGAWMPLPLGQLHAWGATTCSQESVTNLEFYGEGSSEVTCKVEGAGLVVCIQCYM
jgi:hypothetical protein